MIELAKVMLADYRDKKRFLQVRINELKEMEKVLKEMIIDLEVPMPIEVTGAKATIRNGYTRTSWNGRGLSGYAVAHPEILAFRKQSSVAPAVVIKVEK